MYLFFRKGLENLAFNGQTLDRQIDLILQLIKKLRFALLM